jgi:hypothetical protein
MGGQGAEHSYVVLGGVARQGGVPYGGGVHGGRQPPRERGVRMDADPERHRVPEEQRRSQ